MSKPQPRQLTEPGEPLLLWFIKSVAYLGALFLYFIFVTSPYGLMSTLITAVIVLGLGRLYGARLSDRGALLFVFITFFSGWLISATLEQWRIASLILGPAVALRFSDALFLAMSTFALVGGLRIWGTRSRLGSALEGGFILLSVIQLFAAHRGGQIHEPRFFTDWVLIGGYRDINWWLSLFGLGVASLALIMMSRVRRTRHLVLASIVFSVLIAVLYGQLDFQPTPRKIEPITFGESSGDQGHGGGEGKEGKSNANGEGGNTSGDHGEGGGSSSTPPRPPVPVAVAVFHDDYESQPPIFYFRQSVLSYFDGVKLVAEPSAQFDLDVITRFPNAESIRANQTQIPSAHVEVSTSMYLIDEHPSPPMLTHGVELRPLENPDPQRFATAYGVLSFVPSVPIIRHLGKGSVPKMWSPKMQAHYLATHQEDPRYVTLAQEIIRELPSSLSADPIARALAIKRYLEEEGYYTLKVKHRSQQDPVAPFLFGDLRGYCVHFAHSAVHLLRSQGIAARVALGYAVDARTRSSSSAVVITGDRAHAWPEIHIDGVGWVTFDIYPQHSDEPPPSTVSQSLESLLGELARDQVKRGLSEEPVLPWYEIGLGLVIFFGMLISFGYLISIARLVRIYVANDDQMGGFAYLATLDRLSGGGLRRAYGESREAYARRLSEHIPSLVPLASAHGAWALGSLENRSKQGQAVYEMAQRARSEFASNHRLRWMISWLNPFSWLLSR